METLLIITAIPLVGWALFFRTGGHTNAHESQRTPILEGIIFLGLIGLLLSYIVDVEEPIRYLVLGVMMLAVGLRTRKTSHIAFTAWSCLHGVRATYFGTYLIAWSVLVIGYELWRLFGT